MRRRVFLKKPAKQKKNCEIYPHSIVQIFKKKGIEKSSANSLPRNILFLMATILFCIWTQGNTAKF